MMSRPIRVKIASSERPTLMTLPSEKAIPMLFRGEVGLDDNESLTEQERAFGQASIDRMWPILHGGRYPQLSDF